MSESGNDTVAAAFDELVSTLKAAAFSPESDATSLARIIGYMQAVGPIVSNWKAGLPVSGKTTGKRGRKPGSKNAPRSGSVEPEGEGDDLGATQVETDLPVTGRSQRQNF